MRRIYLDNIRWIAVVLVVLYHVIYMFNGVEVFGIIGAFHEVQYQDIFLYVVYPWFMLLLFVVSGMCSRYYLENRTEKEFVRDRTRKLLVPSTIGLFVFYWILGYYNMAIGGAFETLPADIPFFVKYLIMVASGIGPLWYIQMLWLFSLLLVLVRKIEKERLYNRCAKASVWILLLFSAIVWGASQILNTPIITVYRFGIYGFGFFVGYFVFSHDDVMRRLEAVAIPLVIAATVLGVAFVIIYWQMPYAESVVLKTALCNIYAWFSVLAILAFMKKYGNFENSFASFMQKQSWGLYLFHYTPLAITAFYLNRFAGAMPAVLHYIITAVMSFAVSFLLNEVIKRIPIIRWCVMGLKKS